jgi:hypothetical protein
MVGEVSAMVDEAIAMMDEVNAISLIKQKYNTYVEDTIPKPWSAMVDEVRCSVLWL